MKTSQKTRIQPKGADWEEMRKRRKEIEVQFAEWILHGAQKRSTWKGTKAL